MDCIQKACKTDTGSNVKHVSLSFKDETRQRLIIDMGKLAKVARRDFPKMDPLSITVEVIESSQYLNKIGIGFDVPADERLPKEYTETILFR